MLNSLVFSAQTIAPIFILILLGYILRRTGIIGNVFISSSSVIVFRIALPVMLFQKMAVISSIPVELYRGMAVYIAVTLIAFTGTWAAFLRLEPPQTGSMVQGSFRGNVTIIGLAIIESRFSSSAVQIAAVFLVVVMPLYNLLAIIVLSRSSRNEEIHVVKKVLLEIVKNPMIWAILLGLPFGLLKISIPQVIGDSMGYISRLTLPLALIGIGGSLNLKGLLSRKMLWSSAMAIKLLVIPALMWIAAAFFSIGGETLIVMVLSSACPAAVTGFIMAEAMGADGELSGEIISASTLFSMLTFTLWMGLLTTLV